MALAAERGAGGSGMTAVTATIEQVEQLLSGSDVIVANHNDPRQVVVSGSIPALEDAERRFGTAGMKVPRLPVAAAFHSPILARSLRPLPRFLPRLAVHLPAL